tara:strand:- start:8373 stop:9590 length:1218 start_codon:yes stop_codon:yes gene_type:complete
MALLSVAKVFAKKAATSMVKSTATKSGGAIVKAKPVKAKGGALTVVKKGAIKKKKVDKDVFMKEKQARKRQQELKGRKDKENLLEAADDTPDKKGKKKKKKKQGGFLQRLIDFITLILVGWIVDKVPKIIEWVKNLIEKIKEIVKNIKGFFKDIGDFFVKIGKVIGKAWEVISNLKFEDITGLVNKGFSKIKDAFGNIFNRMKDGVKNFLGLSKKDTKGKTIDENTTAEELKDPEFKSVVGDMKNTMGKMSDDWSQTTGKMEEAITGSEITGNKDNDKVISTPKEKTISMERGVTGRFDMNTGKMYINKKEVSSEEYGEFVNMSDKEKVQKYGKIKTNTPKLNKTTVSTKSITPDRKGEEIIVIDDDSPSDSSIQSSTGKSSTKIIVVEASVNSVVDKQLLTNLA